MKAKKEDEEQIDLNNFTGPEPQQPVQSKLMQTRINSQMRGRTAQDGKRPPKSVIGMADQGNDDSPIVYQASMKQESEEQKILRYERVID